MKELMALAAAEDSFRIGRTCGRRACELPAPPTRDLVGEAGLHGWTGRRVGRGPTFKRWARSCAIFVTKLICDESRPSRPGSCHDWPLEHGGEPRAVRCVRRGSKSIPRAAARPAFAVGCRQCAYERRKWSKPHPIELLARDLATVQVRDLIRQIVRDELVLAGIILPPSPPKPKRRGPPLRVVTFTAGPDDE